MLFCQIENHDDSQILGCCIKQDCKHPRPYCQYCMTSLHFDHFQQLKSFKQLNELILQKMKSYDYLMNMIQQIKISINTIYEIVNPLYVHPLDNVQSLSHSYLNDQIIKLMKIEVAEATGGLIVNIKELNNRIYNLCCKFQNLKSFPIKQTNFSEQIYQRRQQDSYVSIEPQLEKQNQEISQNLPIHFSSDYKDRYIELENSSKKAINLNFGWKVAICEPKIPNNNCPITFQFKIINANACDIGVCHRNKIIQANYQPELVKASGHGIYCINQQGYVYSNLNQNINNQKQSISFKNNDIISVEVNYQKQRILWTNQTLQNQYSMKFDITEDLYPCVGISYGEIITILNT
ncbi:unnamed protein product (macronuclear) [Paramecium tetraurelia]|uniref:SPRY domain-containing protein n=1 Tax=Paramecium tetraurelia TaxID=5888 RepID=A0C7Z5_PARTE|nr:uncharacterized protein GSPATT00036043001 [Paramecium tetraurelia]CAK66912.1 unnamed protein product [Paramecium tetraurelia]|eukprot:XP_001434309.1 hypothetical protein (macronuclear) [Paramecium tetraurelia strain d4-2]